jgi:hypothetical protein
LQVAGIGHEIEAEEAIAREAWNKKVEVRIYTNIYLRMYTRTHGGENDSFMAIGYVSMYICVYMHTDTGRMFGAKHCFEAHTNLSTT